MKRIPCENESCDEILSADESLCERCSHHQMTRQWAFLLLVIYYPIVALLTGFVIVLVGMLFFPSRFWMVGPVPVLIVIAVLYVFLAAHGIHSYRQRQRRIARREEESGYTG